MAKTEDDQNLICVAEIIGVHGIKGMVKLKSFVDDQSLLTRHGALLNQHGQPGLTLTTLQNHKNTHLAMVEGITDRTAAERLKGTRLYLTRDALPAIESDDTFYHIDLIGLKAKHVDGTMLGTVTRVANFGAGDLLEIKPENKAAFFVPFTNDIVPTVDLNNGTIEIDPPKGLIND